MLRTRQNCNSLCGDLLECFEICNNIGLDSSFCNRFEADSTQFKNCLVGVEVRKVVSEEGRVLTAIHGYHSLGLTAVLSFLVLVGVVGVFSVISMCQKGGSGGYNAKGHMAKVRFGTDLKESQLPPTTVKKSPTPVAQAQSKTYKSGGLQAVFGAQDEDAEELGDGDLPPPPKTQFDVDLLKNDMMSAIQIVKSRKTGAAPVEEGKEKVRKHKSKKIRKTGSLVSDRSGPTEFDQEMASDNGEAQVEYSGNELSEELQEALERFSEASRKSGISLTTGEEDKEKPRLKAKFKEAKSKSPREKSKSEVITEPASPRSQVVDEARPSSSYLRAVSERERPESIFRPSPQYLENYAGKPNTKGKIASKATTNSNVEEIM